MARTEINDIPPIATLRWEIFIHHFYINKRQAASVTKYLPIDTSTFIANKHFLEQSLLFSQNEQIAVFGENHANITNVTRKKWFFDNCKCVFFATRNPANELLILVDYMQMQIRNV